MAAKVGSGDPENIEAQAARIYWPALFGTEFRRSQKTNPINSLLNYGYAIIRSTMARALASSGLHPAFALFHRDARNALALVDDLMEPYRPIVDMMTTDLWRVYEGICPEAKSALASIPASDIDIGKEHVPVFGCMIRTVRSLVLAMETKEPSIWYPPIISLAS